MGWVDLDLNLPPPPPDPDSCSPCPSPTPVRDQGRADGFGDAAGVTREAPGQERERERVCEREEDRVIGRDREDVGVGVRGGVIGGESALRVSDGGERGEAVGGAREGEERGVRMEVDGGERVDVAVRADVNVDVENSVLLSEQDATDGRVERKVESDDEEDDVVSRARGRVEANFRVPGGASAEAGGVASAAEDGIEQQVEQKPVRKRLRTLGQLRNQKIERTTSIASPSRDREKSSTSSSPQAAAASQPRIVNPLKMREESGGDEKDAAVGLDSKQKHFSEEKLERSSGGLAVSESSKHLAIENLSHQDEKMQVDGEEGSSESKKKVVSVKDVNSDKRRRSIVVLDGEAPPKRPRLPRHPLKKTRSFGGVIVGEKLDEGSKPFAKVSKLESPQSSETGKISNKLENGKEFGVSSEMMGTGRKLSKTKSLKEDDSGDDNGRDVEMAQLLDNVSEVAEGGGAPVEKQEDKPCDASVGVTVPRRPRKMKETTVPPSRAARSSKPPPAVKPTEFIRPTVKKPSVATPSSRPSSASGNSSRSDLRQDTSMERLQREATCSKLWQSPGLFLAFTLM